MMSDIIERLERQMYESECDPNLIQDAIDKIEGLRHDLEEVTRESLLLKEAIKKNWPEFDFTDIFERGAE